MIALALGAVPARSQWVDQSFEVKPGWSAVFLHVDASHRTLQDLVGSDPSNPIDQVWLWKPDSSVAQFIQNPDTPAPGNSQWLNWRRLENSSSVLQRLPGNHACLVHSTATGNYTWTITGKPVPPSYAWTSSGMNLLGFSTPESNPPVFDTFLSPAPSFRQAAEIFNYPGGEFSASNPRQLFTMITSPVKRGEAYWIRADRSFNRYFGPFEVTLQDRSGIHFSDLVSQYEIRLKNVTPNSVAVTLRLASSGAVPAGQRPIIGLAPLLMRKELNPTNLVYSYTNFVPNAQTIQLARAGDIGSEVNIVVGIDRASMPGNANDLYAGVLRLTDSTGLLAIDLPVTTEVPAKGGLWVGNATVTHVQHYLKSYARDGSGQPMALPGGNGAPYVVTNINTSLGLAARSFPLRLIMHHDGTNQTHLLQRVYTGYGKGTNYIVATQESFLHPELMAQARRISAPHLPWTRDNAGWAFAPGQFGPGGKLTNVITIAHAEHASNPFLHTYHPDHDDLNAQFSASLARGIESYDIERRIVLEFFPPAPEFEELTSAGKQFSGSYTEDLTFRGRGSEERTIRTAGTFQISRISSEQTLTR